MRKIVFLATLISLTSQAEETSPDQVVLNVLNAMKTGNCDAIAANSIGNAQATQQLRLKCERDSDVIKDVFIAVKEFRVRHVQINGNDAWVQVDLIMLDENATNGRENYRAIKTEQGWKANFF